MKRTDVLSLSALSLLTMPFPALAEEAAKKGLPQLDATFYPDLLIWLAVCFPLLFLLMRFWIVPAFQETQGNRRQILETDIYDAKVASENADGVRRDFEAALASAHAEAAHTVEGILADVRREAEQENAAQQKTLSDRIDDSERRIMAARDAAVAEAPQAVEDLARSIVDRLLARA